MRNTILAFLLFPVVLIASSFQTKPYDDLGKGDNVVTNVNFSVTDTNDVKNIAGSVMATGTAYAVQTLTGAQIAAAGGLTN